MFANPMMEQLPRKRLEDFQLKLLQKQLAWAAEKSKFYRELFQKAGARAADVKSLDDLQSFPFTDNAALSKAGLYDRITLPLSTMVRYGLAGTAEMTATQGDVTHDIDRLSRALIAAGVNRTFTVGILGDLSDVQLLNFIYTTEAIGATAVPMGVDESRWNRLLDHLQLDALVGFDTCIAQLVSQRQASDMDALPSVKNIFCIHQTAIQDDTPSLMKQMKVKFCHLYAPTALGTAGMLYPCERRREHLAEDYFYAEVIAFGSDHVCQTGHMGELVVTTLQAEALPLIRFRTRQAVTFTDAPCSCGRTHRRVLLPSSL